MITQNTCRPLARFSTVFVQVIFQHDIPPAFIRYRGVSFMWEGKLCLNLTPKKPSCLFLPVYKY